jgi:hypothetical protein
VSSHDPLHDAEDASHGAPEPALAAASDPTAPAYARAVARRLPTRFRHHWLDATERNVFFARCSTVTSLLMAAWKIAVAIIASASLFWSANAAFSVGIAAAKYLAITAHRPNRPDKPQLTAAMRQQRQHRVYRIAGVVILALAVAYILGCIPMVRGRVELERYDVIIGITIATLTFTELGMAIHGAIAARRSSDLVVEMIKLSNLAGALILLVLTQSALISMGNGAAPSWPTGLGGLFFGTLVGGIGLYMLLRRLPPTA